MPDINREPKYYETFREFIKGLAERYGDDPAITTYTKKGEEVTRSYKKLCEDAAAFGNGLHSAGFEKVNVAMAAENSYEWLVAYLGITSTGNTAVMIDAELPEDRMKELIDFTDCQLVVTSESVMTVFGKTYDKDLVVIGTPVRDRDISFAEICENIAPEDADYFDRVEVSGTDMAAIFFTSGTVGRPKAAMLSQKGLIYNAADAIRSYVYCTKHFTSLPMFHTYGLGSGVFAFLHRGSHICLNGNMKTLMRDLQTFDPVNVIAVPLIVEMLEGVFEKYGGSSAPLDYTENSGKKGFFGKGKKAPVEEPVIEPIPELVAIKNKVIGPSFSRMISGGAYINVSTVRHMAEYGVNVTQGYGITECSPVVSLDTQTGRRTGSIGKPVLSSEVSIIDDEICVRGPGVMLGYYKDPELTKEAIVDGWFRTGDKGRIDEEGYLFIEGRMKNIIVFKNGKKISPEEVEEEVMKIDFVKEAVAYGATNGETDDDVRLAVMIYPDQEKVEGLNDFEIHQQIQSEIDRINAGYPSFRHIQMISLCQQPFEKTSIGKIKRNIGK